MLNYTTRVPARRTIQEITDMLGEHGADAVTVAWSRDPAEHVGSTAGREPVAVGFVLDGPHGSREFRLPVNIDEVAKLLGDEVRAGKIKLANVKMTRAKVLSREHATNVAWRVVKDWLEAQLALVAARMASLDEVMLPYLMVPIEDGRQATLYQAYRAHDLRALTTGDDGG